MPDEYDLTLLDPDNKFGREIAIVPTEIEELHMKLAAMPAVIGQGRRAKSTADKRQQLLPVAGSRTGKEGSVTELRRSLFGRNRDHPAPAGPCRELFRELPDQHLACARFKRDFELAVFEANEPHVALERALDGKIALFHGERDQFVEISHDPDFGSFWISRIDRSRRRQFVCRGDGTARATRGYF